MPEKCNRFERFDSEQPEGEIVVGRVSAWDITKAMLADQLTTAFEGGSNYWIKSVRMTVPPTEKKGDTFEWGHQVPMIDGGFLLVEDDGVGYNAILSKGTLLCGLFIMEQQYPDHFRDIILEQGDANTADILVQLACFGELVFC